MLGRNLGWPDGLKIGMATNPTILNRPYYSSTTKTLGPRYLNGLSVELLGYGSGVASVKVRYGDVEIDRDVRWAGNDIRLPNITGDADPDLVVQSGITVILDRSGTPDRHELDPQTGLFVNDTGFRCEAGSLFRLGQGGLPDFFGPSET